ncbi:Glutathione S-transferase PM239X14 OS=Arabidopsis thaliana PE=2 SV=1 [Rhizoctonia solani AG-1 IB]|uniref:glutathione transferase n=1 Tax=Thanatephorus cucumeris (strain AG1-IB / isolate 7/3/14) TaxID=1108050 RepID=A0A0B7FCP2_THACB|nr:Glutathione S-transferase PM239X14 OS=Arabidopsis thaliana PE=2 SV=1 [Rhizoctonia solani AG-1 IB]
MVTVKLYGHTHSIWTHLVWATAKEISVDIDLVIVDLPKGEHKVPEFIENLNPFGMVPVLVDEDGTQIYESHAICRYLIAKYAPSSVLLPNPSDLKAYGLFEQAASIEYSNFSVWGHSIAIGRIVAPMKGLPVDEAEIEKAVETLTSNMKAYESILSKQKYLAGDVGISLPP